MAITINPLTHVIYVPKSDLSLIQASPEVRELDLNWFRLELKSLEDDGNYGIFLQKTHDHNTEVTLSGLTYARIIEILYPYTVEFENGSYTINCVGANHNLGDVKVPNSTSLIINNAAGLINNAQIEYASFGNAVTVDLIYGTAGTLFPIGTPQTPSNNFSDALLIAATRGFSTLAIRGDALIDGSNDFSNFEIIGQSVNRSTFTIHTDSDTVGCVFKNATITGTLDGENFIDSCVIIDLTYVNGSLINCGLVGDITLAGNINAVVNDCYTIDQDDPPVIDMGGSGQSLAMPNYSGLITIENLSDADQEIGIGVNHGMVILDSTITAGTIIIAGIGVCTDNSTGTASVNTDALMSKDTVSEAVNDEIGEEIQYNAFNGVVTLDTLLGSAGTAYPIGTQNEPVNNLTDAKSIASTRGFNTIEIKSPLTITTGHDISNLNIVSDNFEELTIESGVTSQDANFIRISLIDGEMNGYWNIFEDCWIYNMTNFCGWLRGGSFENIELAAYTASSLGQTYFDDIVPMYSGSTAVIKMNTKTSVAMTGIKESILITSLEASSLVESGLLGGHIYVASSCTGGEVIVRGVGEFDNYSSYVIINDDGLMSQDTVSQAVWDEVLDLSSHNINESAGKMLRTSYGMVLNEGIAQGNGNGINQLQLASTASSSSGAYDPAMIVTTNGTGAGQARIVYQYNSSTKTVTVDRDWKVQPDNTTEYIIYANAAREHVNEGLCQGGTANTVTLNAAASDDTNAYRYQLIFIRSGYGADQVRHISAYDGVTKIATVGEAWSHIPDTTSGYVILPTHVHPEGTANKVWEHDSAIRALGLMQENHYLDNTVYTTYNGQKLLTSGRIRLYSNPSSVGTATDCVASYLVTATWTNDEMDTYQVIKVS